MSSYVIIGVHGLANKPDEKTLSDWWNLAMVEGLKRNQRRRSDQPVEFDLVYWADARYDKPIADDKNMEPYRPADGEGPFNSYHESWIDTVIGTSGEMIERPLDWAKKTFAFDTVAEAVLRAKLQDLSAYYHDAALRDKLRGLLRRRLLDHEGKRIMVLAHSMGSIIAYDVLRELGRQNPYFRVSQLVTIGSPLGLPHVKWRIYQENDLVRTPTIVDNWTNYADRRDPVAMDAFLASDYGRNDRGVRVRDDLVINEYVGPSGKANHHKSYGYLRTPEFSSLLRGFL